MKQKAVSKIYSYITSQVLPLGVERVERRRKDPYKEEGWIGLNTLL